MALGDKANQQTSRVQTGAGQQDTREKAAAFWNFDFPTKDGDKKRLTSLALMQSDPFHAQILEYLSDPATREERIKLLTAKLIGTVNFIKTGDAALLDL